jgi:hypothetical protein
MQIAGYRLLRSLGIWADNQIDILNGILIFTFYPCYWHNVAYIEYVLWIDSRV